MRTIRERMVLDTPPRCLPASNPMTWLYNSNLAGGIGEPSKSIRCVIATSIASAPVVV